MDINLQKSMKTKPAKGKNAQRCGLVLVGILLALFAISFTYYKAPVTSPLAVWHGVNMSIRSLLPAEDSLLTELPNDRQTFARTSLSMKISETHYPTVVAGTSSAGTLAQSRAADHDLKNRIAASRAVFAELEKQQSRLNQANQQLLNSSKTLGGITDDFSSVAAYQQAELARQQVITDAQHSERDVPDEATVAALVTPSSGSRDQVASTIPAKVLHNVQQTTGISPEEINTLMNQ